MAPSDLARLLGQIPMVHDGNVLVGEETSDDAGIYLITPDLALVLTVDFFPPVIQDPYMYGRIAASNSLSDVWAMGGTPFVAMNIVGFPDDVLDVSVLADILRGGADTAREAGVSIIGGHTMRDKEIKYGMSVTGRIHPSKVVRNVGAKLGDRLILTKPLGIGVITTAMRVDAISGDLTSRVAASMAALNKDASEAMVAHGASAATDITGFGLAGHMLEMAKDSGLTFSLKADRIPIFGEAVGLARDGYLPAGSFLNKKFFSPDVAMDPYIPDELGDLFFDAQTSGGMLIAVPAGKSEALLGDLRGRGVSAASEIGEVVEFRGRPIEIKV